MEQEFHLKPGESAALDFSPDRFDGTLPFDKARRLEIRGEVHSTSPRVWATFQVFDNNTGGTTLFGGLDDFER